MGSRKTLVTAELSKKINDRVRLAVNQWSCNFDRHVTKALDESIDKILGVGKTWEGYRFAENSQLGKTLMNLVESRVKEVSKEFELQLDNIIKQKFNERLEELITTALNQYNYRDNLRHKIEGVLSDVVTEKIAEHIRSEEATTDLLAAVGDNCKRLLVDITNPDDTNDKFGELVLRGIVSTVADCKS